MLGSSHATRIGRTFGMFSRQGQKRQRSALPKSIEQLESRQMLATIHGQKWLDIDANGQRSNDEPGIDDWGIQLLEWNGQEMPDWEGLLPGGGDGHLVQSTLTASVDSNGDGIIDPFSEQGQYAFTDLAPGTYIVREVPRAGWTQTTRTTNTTVASQLDAQFNFYLDVDFFDDWQGRNERWVRSANQGHEWFYILPDGGLYDWDEVSGQLLGSPLNGTLVAQLDPLFYDDPSLLAVAPIDLNTIVVLADHSATGEANFGNFQFGSVVGRKWRDRDGDGVQGDGEPYLNGWTIELRDTTGSLVSTALTQDLDVDGNGSIEPDKESGWYTFSGVAPGTYTLREVQQSGWQQTWPVSGEYSVTIGSGSELQNLHFGNLLSADDQAPPEPQPGSIHGRKWRDLNANGVRDADEPYLNGWVIQLVDQASGIVASATTSNSDLNGDGTIDAETEVGVYRFEGLTPATYTVREVMESGWVQSFPINNEHTVVVGENQTIQNLDFGNHLPSDIVQSGSISGRNWRDLNGDGSRDADEPYLNGWDVQLLDGSGAVIAVATTGDVDLNNDGAIDPETESGRYSFESVLPAEYTVQLVQQSGWVRSFPATGAHIVTVANGQARDGLDFGNYLPSDMVQPGSVSGRNWRDLDGDGTRDANEPYLNGWDVQLLDGTGAVIAVATTGDVDLNNDGVIDPETESGRYAFESVLPATYTVRLIRQSGWVQSFPATGAHTVTVANGQTMDGLDFANHLPSDIVEPGVLRGRKWRDLDADGARDADEPYLNGWDIQLIDDAGATVATVTTGSLDLNGNGAIEAESEAGWYSFFGVTPGAYTVREIMQAGWIQSFPSGNVHAIVVAESETIDGLNFGNHLPADIEQQASLSGRKWHDLNGDGVRDPNEPYLNGWEIQLVDEAGNVVATVTTEDVDRNDNGTIEPETESGWFTIDPLAGTYTVREVQQTGWVQSFPSGNAHTVTVAAGDAINELNFGNHLPTDVKAWLRGRKWHDLNGDGIRDPDEPYLSGWEIQLVDEAGNVVATTTTEDVDRNDNGTIEPETESGWFTIDPLAGTYTVREVQQSGWVQSFPVGNEYEVTVSAGDAINQLDFGNHLPTDLKAWLRGRKWHDLNGDGIRDPNEPYLNGWEIELVDEAGNVVATTTTEDVDRNDDGTIEPESESGWFTIDPFEGTYTVREVQQSGWVQSFPDGGQYTVTVGVRDSINELDFGNHLPTDVQALLSGRKWHDRDGDGARDPNEPYLNGWEIQLWDESGNVVATTTTTDVDLDGNGTIDSETETGWYSMRPAAGSYTVREVLQAGWVQSFPSANQYSVTVEAGDAMLQLDFGNHRPSDLAQPGAIRGRKWRDLNADGVRDANEPYLNGWDIQLFDAAGFIVAVATTEDLDLNGNGTIEPDSEMGWYSFDSVEPASYTVSELLQSNSDWLQSFPNGNQHLVTVAEGQAIQGLNFGNYLPSDLIQPGSIHGRKWRDFNVNGVRDPDEPYLNGWGVELVSVTTGLVVATTTTANMDLNQNGSFESETERGWYWFSDVEPGEYIVRERLKNGWSQSSPTNGQYELSVANGQVIDDINFGNYLPSDLDPPAKIHGQKWHDLNADGVRDPNEPYLNGWTIELIDATGNVVATTVTGEMDADGDGTITPDENGWYWFEDLASGSYSVREVLQEDWLASFPDPSDKLARELDQEFDFMRHSPDFRDSVGQGERWFQSGVGDWDWFYITPVGDVFRLNNNLTLDDGATFITRLSSRYYDNLELLIDVPVPTPRTFVVNNGAVVEGVDFGNYQDGAIHGRVWKDENANGTIDAGEPFLNDWTLELVAGNGQKINTVSTMDMDLNGDGQIDPSSESGWYWFEGLRPDEYTIDQQLPQGWTQSFPTTTSSIRIESGQQVVDANFGNHDLILTVQIVDAALARLGAVGQISIIFDRPVSGFGIGDISLTLEHDEFIELSLADATLTTSDNRVWTLGNLSELTRSAGKYEVSVHRGEADIFDGFGNPLLIGDTHRWIHGPGDANLDGVFDQFDLVEILQSNKYLTGEPARWSEGDWNFDGVFDTQDIVMVLQLSHYLNGPFAAKGPQVSSPAELSTLADAAFADEF